jgi:general secretion pathway protein G
MKILRISLAIILLIGVIVIILLKSSKIYIHPEPIVPSDLMNIAMSLQRYEIDCERFPTTQEGLSALLITPTNVTGWNGPYLFYKQSIDPWGNPYQYKYTGIKEQPFEIWSLGPDGKDGTSDDIHWPIKSNK